LPSGDTAKRYSYLYSRYHRTYRLRYSLPACIGFTCNTLRCCCYSTSGSRRRLVASRAAAPGCPPLLNGGCSPLLSRCAVLFCRWHCRRRGEDRCCWFMYSYAARLLRRLPVLYSGALCYLCAARRRCRPRLLPSTAKRICCIRREKKTPHLQFSLSRCSITAAWLRDIQHGATWRPFLCASRDMGRWRLRSLLPAFNSAWRGA